MQALISLCDGEDDYFEEFFDIRNSSEESAQALIKEVCKYDWHKLHCVRVRVDKVEHRFDRDELREMRQECPTCRMPDLMKPSHNGSPRCQSGSIASGGKNAHCTCDVCF
jgi:hypothetical protein